MKIVNLKQDAPEMEMRPSDYPWSLCLHLCVVVALRQDGDCRSMELQITDLGVDAGRKTTAGKMYPTARED